MRRDFGGGNKRDATWEQDKPQNRGKRDEFLGAADYSNPAFEEYYKEQVCCLCVGGLKKGK